MSSDLWANVASGAVGGVLALGGHWLVHILTTRADDKKRRSEAAARRLDELKSLYVAYLDELNQKSRKTSEIITRKHASQTDLQDFLREHHLLATTDVYFRLRMVETDAQGMAWIKEIGESDRNILALAHAPFVNQQYLFEQVNPVLVRVYEFQEWIYTHRFSGKS